MLASVVIYRRHRRPSRHSRALPRLFPFNIPTCKPSNLPTFGFPYVLPSSVSRNSFSCHSYENCRGVYQQFPLWNSPLLTHHSPLVISHCTQVLSFHTLAHSFALSCIFLHSRKTQLFSFQAIPHSLPKNTRVGVGPLPTISPLVVSCG